MTLVKALGLFAAILVSCTASYGQGQSDEDRAQQIETVIGAEQSALAAYFSGRDDQAVSGFKRLIELYGRELLGVTRGGTEDLAIKYDLLLAHGRLAIVHGRRNEAEERDKNLSIALAYAKECLRPPPTSVSTVRDLVLSVDKNYAKR